MSFVALLLTLLLERFRPLPVSNPVHNGLRALTDGVQANLNAGRRRHGFYAWLLLVGGLAGLAWLADVLLGRLSWFASLALHILVLHFAFGFRPFGRQFTRIQQALAAGDVAAARALLVELKGAHDESISAVELDAGEVARQSIEAGLLLAHRHVFGVLFWYVLLPGPVGAVVYRLADYAARRWNRRLVGAEAVLPADRFGEFAAVAFEWIDWIPSRLTASGFAIVGDFEGAAYCWRRVSQAGHDRGALPSPEARLVIIAAASGALGQRILTPADTARYLDEPGMEGGGLVEPQADTPRSVVGLVWRAIVLWMLLLLLLTIVAQVRP